MGIPDKYYYEMVKKKKTKNKYGNSKIEYDVHTFDSLREKRRYAELKLLERAGKIKDLELQKKFELIPSQYEGEGKQRRCVERAVTYLADFTYYDNEKQCQVVEDTKGMRTKDYIIKRKLMRYMLGIAIKEV